MGTSTPSLDLFKPAGSELVNVVTHLNNNLDKIDAAHLDMTGDITSLQTIDTAYDTRLDNLEAADVSLDTRVDTLEAASSTGRIWLIANGNTMPAIANNTDWAVTWSSINESAHNYFSESGVGVIDYSGPNTWVSITASVAITNAGASPVQMRLELFHNGARLTGDLKECSDTGQGQFTINVPILLNTGDSLQMIVKTSNGGATPIGEATGGFIRLASI